MADTSITHPSKPIPTQTYVWYVVWLLFVVNMLNYVDRMILSILIEDIRQEIPMSDAQIGIVTGLAFALFYAFAGLILGRLSDLYSRRKILSIAITGWSLATAACGLAANFWHILAARVLVGFGEAGTMPASQSLLGDYCNLKQRAAAYAILAAGGSMGLTVGLAGGGWLAEQYGWRAAFFIAGAMGLPIAAIVAFTMRDPERGRQDEGASSHEGTSYRETISTLLRNRTYCWIVLASSCTGFMLYGVAQWMPAYLIREYGLSTGEVGLIFGFAMGVGAGIGAIFGGFLTNRLVLRGAHWLLTVPLLVNSVIVPGYWLMLYSPSLEVTIGALFLVNVFGALGFGSIMAGLHSVIPAGMRASGSAIYGLVSSLFGVGLAPFLVGVLSDFFSGGAQDAASLRTALAIAVIVGWGTPVFLWLARKTFDRDLISKV